MDFLWLNMDQNIFKEDSKGGAIVPLRGSRNGSRGQKLDGGFKISAVQVISGKGRDRSIISADYEIYDTRMKIILPSPLKAAGGKVSVKIDFSFISPDYGSDRMGIVETKNGKIYSLGIDVYNGEPDIHPEYLSLPNVFVLPHLGSATISTRTDMGNLAVSNLEEFFKTGKCKNTVN